MDAFYIIVLSIAVILLILILTFIGIQMTNKKTSKQTFPPNASTCPDYWALSDDKKTCILPTTGKNKPTLPTGKSLTDKNTPSCPATGICTSINFADAGWSANGSSSLCSQKTWAQTYNVSWDGVSNYSQC